MRVIHVITRLIVGGAQENTVASVLGLRLKPGLSVTLLSGPDTGSEGSLSSAFNGSPGTLKMVPDLVRPIRPWKDARAGRRLAEMFRAERPDIVHTHSGKAGVLGRLAAARAGVPVIIHTIHGPSFGPFQGALSNWLFRSAERRAGRVTTHFVSVADAMTRQYLAAGIGVPAQYSTIRSGFDMEPFLQAANDSATRARWGLTPEDIVIGKIARLHKLKGHDDLFRVAPGLVQTNPRIKFLIVGDGPWSGRLRQLARDHNLEKYFVFTGLLAPQEIPAILGIVDIVAHLSTREGLARVLPQALAAGKPVVAYDCDGAGEVCLDGETGFLLRPGALAGLTGRLTQLAGDPGLRESLGRRGREFVRGRFSVEQMVESLYALYVKLAEPRTRA